RFVCASWFSPVVMVVHLPGEFSRGKGQRSNGRAAGEGRRRKFLRHAKSFGGVHFTLRMTN
ncbi:hypothetical protein, partial [Enterobacter sp. 01-M-03-SI-ECC_S142]|uniref:hypothetical protein n=1 Tax=unclassified Enterobacter TaxID=2608935 RepID=UPI003862B7D3